MHFKNFALIKTDEVVYIFLIHADKEKLTTPSTKEVRTTFNLHKLVK